MFRFRSLVVFCGAAMVFAAVAFPPLTTFGQARQATADPCTGARDLHLTNGRFVTMDGRGSTATEVTIQDGRFTAGHRAYRIGVVDAQDEHTAPLVREPAICDRRQGVSEVERPRRARGEANAHAHASIGT